MAKGHFEARKWSYRQTKEGIVVSFQIHPDDVPAALATAPLGTVYMIGFAAVDEKEAEAPKPKPPKEKRKFDDLPLVQQAVLRCKEAMFCEWLGADDEDKAADQVRAYCGVDSRSLLDKREGAARKWRNLNEKYVDWLGQQRVIEQARGHGAAA